MSGKKNNEWPATWPAWVIEILEDMEAIESEATAGTGDWGGLNGPKWVQVLGTEIAMMMNPTVQLLKRNMCGPRFLGAVLGHQKWLLDSENGSDRQIERAMQGAEVLHLVLRKKLEPEAYARLVDAHKEKAAEWRERMRISKLIGKRKSRIADKAKRLVEQQTVSEQAEFFEAYSKALKTGIFDEDGHIAVGGLQSTTLIYLLLLLNWQDIASFGSVTNLHAWLCRCLGETQVGSLDRVKTICKRHKIKLAPRGRPHKKQIGH